MSNRMRAGFFCRIKSVQFKLIAVFLFSVLLPLIILIAVLPVWFTDRMEKNARISAESTIASISKNVEIYLSDLENITLIPYINDSVMMALQKKKRFMNLEIPEEEMYEINRALTYELPLYFQLMRNDISELLILPEDGSVYLMSVNSSYYEKEYDYRGQEWYQEAVKSEGRAIFIGNHRQDYIQIPQAEGVISVVRQIRDVETREALAVVMADTETDILERILKSVAFGEGSWCFILDDRQNIVCGSKKVDKNLLEAVQSQRNTGDFAIPGYLTVSCAVEGTRWQVVALLSRSEVFQQSRFVYLLGGAFIILYLFVGSMLFFIFSRYVTKPLGKLSETMQKVQKGDMNIVFHIESEDEIAELGRNFNRMLSQINELIEKEYKAVLAQKDMEYYALSSQIQPHFIYNVLNNLVGLNRAGEKEALEKTVLSLTDILRYMLDHSDMVKVSTELDIIEKYCELQKLRFGERLEYVITCEKEYLSCKIPRLILQPLVENAILHGIEPLKNGGTVTVLGENVREFGKEYLVFTISDNGIGFDTELVNIENSVGIKNIRNRLALVYRESIFEMESTAETGTCVRIRIPEEELENEDCDS